MATRRRSSATKSAKTASAPAKKSRSSAATRMAAALDNTLLETVTPTVTPKYSKPIEIKKVTETPSKKRRFAPTRPEKPNISLEEYVTDFKLRMQINNYEVMELIEDVKKLYHTTSPYIVKTYTYLKDTYDRTFNQEDNKEES